jgi:CarD family transcriptional regulator
MFKVHDVVCYENVGICEIIDIKTMSIMNQDPKDYYLMEKLYDQCELTIIKTPVDTKSIIRNIISKEDAEKMIDSLSEIEPILIDDVKKRQAMFQKLIESWDLYEWAKVIYTIYEMKNVHEISEQKKPFLYTDMKYFERAEKLFNQEIAYALQIDENEVSGYITNALQKNKWAQA